MTRVASVASSATSRAGTSAADKPAGRLAAMRLVHNSNSTMHQPVLVQLQLARDSGCDGVFIRAEHIRRYLAAGLDIGELRHALDGLDPINLGALMDVERRRPVDRAAMLDEANSLTELAVAIGATNIQVLTGPVDPNGSYAGPADLQPRDLRRATSDSLRAVADIGASAGISYYLEPIAWTPLSTLSAAVEAVDDTARDNVGLVLDYWHLWHRGAEPDDLARLDRRLIAGVDFGDSLGPRGSAGTDQLTRRVWPGDGEIPLAEFTAAILSTGFDGWWDNELYSPPHWEREPRAIAQGLVDVLTRTLAAAGPAVIGASAKPSRAPRTR
jgi:sugar phosphate isomerase/epimerase